MRWCLYTRYLMIFIKLYIHIYDLFIVCYSSPLFEILKFTNKFCNIVFTFIKKVRWTWMMIMLVFVLFNSNTRWRTASVAAAIESVVLQYNTSCFNAYIDSMWKLFFFLKYFVCNNFLRRNIVYQYSYRKQLLTTLHR